MSDSLPDPQADVEHLLVQTLEEEERRLAELEERVSRLQSSPQPRGEISEELPPDPSVTQEDLNEARSLLAQSGEHLRQLQGRLNELEGVPSAITEDTQEPSADEDGTDSFQLVLGPGAGASVEPVPRRDALELGDVDSFLPRESAPSPTDLETPATRAGWGESATAPAAPSENAAPPVTSKGWGESTPLPRPQETGVPRPTGGFRSAEIMPDASDLSTPTTSGGWGGDPDASDVFRAEVFVTRPEDPDAPTARHDAPPIDPDDPAFDTSDHLAIQVPPGEPTGASESTPQPTIEPPEVAPQVVLPPPAEAIQGPHPGTPGYLVSAGPAAVAGQIAAAAHADRFDLGNKFGGGREPSLRELWQNQERILRRLEMVAAQVGDMAQTQLNEVDTLRARAERAERICAQALSQAQTRATRWEAAVSGLTSRSEVAAASAPDPLPGATQQLVRLLRDAINASPEPEPEPEPAKPDRFEALRERLLAMGNEHQTLVSRHANLLEDLLGLLDPPAEDEK